MSSLLEKNIETQTKLGQNKLIFWIETRPTNSDTGKSQNKVKPLSNREPMKSSLLIVMRTKLQGLQSSP